MRLFYTTLPALPDSLHRGQLPVNTEYAVKTIAMSNLPVPPSTIISDTSLFAYLQIHVSFFQIPVVASMALSIRPQKHSLNPSVLLIFTRLHVALELFFTGSLCFLG